MIDYTANPDYDIRKLPVGGWNSSKISVQSYGRWLQFADPISNNIINSTLPINYSKKYKPPKNNIKNQCKLKQINDEDLSFDEYLSFVSLAKTDKSIKRSQKIYVPPIELSPERVTMMVNKDFNNTPSSNSFKPFLTSKISNNPEKIKRPNSPNESCKSQASKNNDDKDLLSKQIILHTVFFNDAEIPKTTRIISKRKGEAHTIKSISIHSARTKDKPKTALKPRKTYNETYNNFSNKQNNNDKAMIVYGNRSKTSYGNTD